MVRTISATQAKTGFGALVESIARGEGDVIVENRGAAQVVILSASRYQKLEQLEDENRRNEAVKTLRRLRTEISVQNADLSQEEATAFAKKLVDDTMDSMFASGKLRYKE